MNTWEFTVLILLAAILFAVVYYSIKASAIEAMKAYADIELERREISELESRNEELRERNQELREFLSENNIDCDTGLPFNADDDEEDTTYPQQPSNN